MLNKKENSLNKINLKPNSLIKPPKNNGYKGAFCV